MNRLQKLQKAGGASALGGASKKRGAVVSSKNAFALGGRASASKKKKGGSGNRFKLVISSGGRASSSSSTNDSARRPSNSGVGDAASLTAARATRVKKKVNYSEMAAGPSPSLKRKEDVGDNGASGAGGSFARPSSKGVKKQSRSKKKKSSSSSRKSSAADGMVTTTFAAPQSSTQFTPSASQKTAARRQKSSAKRKGQGAVPASDFDPNAYALQRPFLPVDFDPRELRPQRPVPPDVDAQVAELEAKREEYIRELTRISTELAALDSDIKRQRAVVKRKKSALAKQRKKSRQVLSTSRSGRARTSNTRFQDYESLDDDVLGGGGGSARRKRRRASNGAGDEEEDFVPGGAPSKSRRATQRNRRRGGAGVVLPPGVKAMLDELWNMPIAQPFRYPVDTNVWTDYLSVVDAPMDLSTIRSAVDNNEYENVRALYADLELIYSNCKAFNGPNVDITNDAARLRKVWQSQRRSLLAEERGEVVPKKEAKRSKASNRGRKRKIESMEQPPLAFEEKAQLVDQIQELTEEQLGRVVQVIEDSAPAQLAGQEDGEVDVEVTDLPDAALRKLQKLVRECQVANGVLTAAQLEAMEREYEAKVIAYNQEKKLAKKKKKKPGRKKTRGRRRKSSARRDTVPHPTHEEALRLARQATANTHGRIQEIKDELSRKAGKVLEKDHKDTGDLDVAKFLATQAAAEAEKKKKASAAEGAASGAAGNAQDDDDDDSSSDSDTIDSDDDDDALANGNNNIVFGLESNLNSSQPAKPAAPSGAGAVLSTDVKQSDVVIENKEGWSLSEQGSGALPVPSQSVVESAGVTPIAAAASGNTAAAPAGQSSVWQEFASRDARQQELELERKKHEEKLRKEREQREAELREAEQRKRQELEERERLKREEEERQRKEEVEKLEALRLQRMRERESQTQELAVDEQQYALEAFEQDLMEDSDSDDGPPPLSPKE